MSSPSIPRNGVIFLNFNQACVKKLEKETRLKSPEIRLELLEVGTLDITENDIIHIEEIEWINPKYRVKKVRRVPNDLRALDIIVEPLPFIDSLGGHKRRTGNFPVILLRITFENY